MAQQVVIAGALFNDVPSISVPDSNNVWHHFLDTTIATNAAAASDIAQGKLAYVNGSLVTGTNQGGGGGGGLEYESGTWTPSEDVSDYFITFSGTHSTAPFFYMVCDANGTYDSTSNTNFSITYYNYEQMGGIVISGTSSDIYGEVRFRYRATNSGSTSASAVAINNSTSSTIDTTTPYPKYWAKSTGIRAYTNSASRYWRSTRSYKWVAVWAPTS